MSFFNVDDLKLEQNIYLKELELLHIVEESHGQVAWNTLRRNPYKTDPFCSLHLDFLSSMRPIVRQTSIVKQQIIQAPLGYWNGIESSFHSNDVQSMVAAHSSLGMMKSSGDVHGSFYNNSSNECRSPGVILPVYSHKASLPNMKKAKNNKKKNLYPSSNTAQAHIDYSNVVVNLKEIGLGFPRSKTIDANSLIAKFRRLYIYLTSLCKERKLLESIMYAREYISNGKYILPSNVNVAGHIEYVLKTLSVEMKCVETIIHTIQQRCEDTMLIKLWRDQANNLITGIKMLSYLNGTETARDLYSTDGITRANDLLTALIKSIRYVGIIYAITAQKLLIKETAPYEPRRRTFIGH